MNLIAQYDDAVSRGEINDDPLQREIIAPMQRLMDDLKQNKRSWFDWFSKNTTCGIYLYGPVGVGKTYIVDLFYQELEISKKARFHFHHFMQQIDSQLRKLQGQKDPLRQIAKNIAQSTRVLCFDEFLVHDVAYAMILAKLLPELIEQEVILVISSNTKPDDLYLNGVQRDRFMPVIAAIKKNCEVLLLDDPTDYRLGRRHLMEAYLYPLNVETQDAMQKQFAQIARDPIVNGFVTVQNREIPFLQCSGRIIWFDFSVICDLPRSQLDYLEIARRFDTIFVSNIPCLTEKHTTQAIMFIHFIDVMYDQGVKLIISAAVPTAELYVKGEMLGTFQRTQSRLEEMQSEDYLSRHPRREVQDIL